MDERDRIDIVATLHDRFNKPADDIIRKMDEMERQAEDTGESIDAMSESLDNETDKTKKSAKAIGENTDARTAQGESVVENTKSVREYTRRLRESTRAVRDGLTPTRRLTDETAKASREASEMAANVKDVAEAHQESSDAVQRHTRAITDNTKKTKRARDEFGRFVKASNDATEAIDKNTEATDKNTKSTEEHTEQTKENRNEWTRWENKIRKITSGLGKRFRPVGAFYQNYFKIIGAFRALLFSDIGALIPQLITGIVAIGSAAAATLGPLGRMAGTLGQVAPLIAAFAQTKFVFGAVTDGIKSALDAMQDTNITAEELAKAQKAAGENTWEFAKYVTKLQDEFLVLKRTVRETFLEGMLPVVKDLVNEYMPLLTKELTKTADIMNGALKEGIAELMTPEKKGTIADVMERSSIASGLFVDIMFSLLDVFIELADAAGPAFLETLESVDEKLGKFADWIRENKGALEDFFLRANDTAGEFFRGLGGILNGLYGIAKASEPLTDFLYGGLADKLVAWGEKMNDPEQQKIMRENYEKMIPNLEAIGNLIGAIVDGAKEIATSEYFAPLVNDLADNGIPTIVDMLTTLDETVGPPLLRISEAIDDIDPDVLTTMLQPLGDLLGGLATVLETVVPLFNGMPEPMQKIVMYGLGLTAMGLPSFFLLLGGALKPLKWILDGVVWVFRRFAGLLVDIAESPFGKKVGAFFKPIIDFVKKYAGKFLKFLIPLGKFLGKKSIAVIPVVGTVIAILWTLWDVLKWLWDNVKPFRDFFTGIWDWIARAWHASIDWIVNTAVPWVIDAFTSIWDGIKGIGQSIADFWNKYIQPVIDAVVKIAKFIFVLVGTIVLSIGAVFMWLQREVLGPLAEWLRGKYMDIMTWIGEKMLAIWDGIKTGLLWVWDNVLKPFGLWLADVFMTGIGQIWRDILTMTGWLVDGMTWLWDGFKWILKAIWDFIITWIVKPVVWFFVDYLWPKIKWVIDKLVFGFNWLKDGISLAWAWIKDKAVKPVADWFQTYVQPIITTVVETLKNKFEDFKNGVSSIWNTLKDNIFRVYHDNIKPIFDAFTGAIEALRDSFSVAVDGIGLIWQGLKDKLRGPTQYVVDVVYNNGIRKIWNELSEAVDLGVTLPTVSFGGGGGNENKRTTNMGGGRRAQLYTGGIAEGPGGYTGPGSKYQPAGVVHADEFVIRKTSQRNLRREAPGFLDMLNRYGARALSMVGAPGYDGGGKVTDAIIGGATGGGIRMGAAAAAGADGDAILDMNNPFGGMLDRFTKGLREKFSGSGKFLDIGVGLVKKFVNGVTDFSGQKMTSAWDALGAGMSGMSSALGGVLAGKISGSGWGRVSSAAAATGLRMTSSFRRGARTAGSGSVSLHAQGRARDYAGSAGAMRAFFNAMDKPPYPTELLYSPMGSRNIHRGGRRYANTGKTRANHFNHVHVGFDKGGLVPFDHMRFMGGPVDTWGSTLVGEFGPEIFTPSNGGLSSLVGLHGPEVMEFNREGAIMPHKAVAALSEVNEGGHHTENNNEQSESNYYDVKVTVGGGSSEADIEGAVYKAIAKAERKKRERR